MRVRLLRSLRGVRGSLGVVSRSALVFQGPRTIDVVRRDGTRVASVRFASGEIDAGVSVSPDERSFAFRPTDFGTSTVFVLRAGARVARAIYRHRLGPSGCGRGAGLGWSGRFLLYDSTDGQLAVLDSLGRPALDVRAFAARLPEQNRGERADAWWANEF
ncbi:MAG TPA: hypothetical protein VFA66_11415 [Gaiellaceae bacterium]|nr:hypothetical protein [Gaiellaceae bacterium]